MTKAWELHEETIKSLYVKYTLKEVRQIMIDQYGFKASTRAYRGRLDRWGVTKYNCKKRKSRTRSPGSPNPSSDANSVPSSPASSRRSSKAKSIGASSPVSPSLTDRSDSALMMPIPPYSSAVSCNMSDVYSDKYSRNHASPQRSHQMIQSAVPSPWEMPLPNTHRSHHSMDPAAHPSSPNFFDFPVMQPSYTYAPASLYSSRGSADDEVMLSEVIIADGA